MGIQRCEGCGGLFANLPRGVCANCLDQREQEYRTVRDWLRVHRGASIPEAAAATGIDEGVIVRFIREERIEIVDPAADPVLRATREDEERRAELVRRLAERERFGTSVRADLAPAAQPDESVRRRSGHGMQTRRR